MCCILTLVRWTEVLFVDRLTDVSIDREIGELTECSETTLTGESRFHISPPWGFEPVTLVAGSKQVSPLDQ
jgi:hypothetical protein